MVTNGGVLLEICVLHPALVDVTSFVNAQRVAGNSTFALMFKHSNVTFDDQADFYQIIDSNDDSATRSRARPVRSAGPNGTDQYGQ